MFKNYLKIAFRNIVREKKYSIMNILGLSIGIASCLFIFLYVQHELSYDKFHKNADRIYRVVGPLGVHTQDLLAPALQEYFPEIEQITRIDDAVTKEPLIRFKDKEFYVSNFWRADPNFFDFFSFNFIKGDPSTALANPNCVVITQEMADKIFGDIDPINQIIQYENNTDFKVTGVIQNIPDISHIKFDFLASCKGYNFQYWFMYSSVTYILMHPDHSPQVIEKRFPDFIKKYLPENMVSGTTYQLQALADIHLHSHLSGELSPNNDIRYIWLFSALAILILMIASINFINIKSAQVTHRFKEMGIRKVLGARQKEVIHYLFVESFLLCFISLIVAYCILELYKPVFENYFQYRLRANTFTNFPLILTSMGMVLVISVLSSLYPTFIINRLSFDKLFGKMTFLGTFNFTFRRILIVVQFIFSIALIISTLIIHNQLNYIQNKNLGYNQEQLLVIRARRDAISNAYQPFKDKLLENNQIVSVCSGEVPGETGGFHITIHMPETNSELLVRQISGDIDYVKTLGFQIIEGRNFSEEFPTDFENKCIINETLVKEFDISNPIDNDLKLYNDMNYKIIGIMKDFHMQSLHEQIIPIIIKLNKEVWPTLLIRIDSDNINESIQYIQNAWKTFVPHWPMDYSFLDESLNLQYNFERKLGTLFNLFAMISVLISCLGLFGLVSLSLEQRTKEIGIRKVIGATQLSIVNLFTKEYFFLIIIANLIAWPIVYYAMNKWLQNFAYHVDLSWWIFVLAGVSALVIALLTVSYQAVRAATANPVESLRYE